MRQQQYLNNRHVIDFIEWLKLKLNNYPCNYNIRLAPANIDWVNHNNRTVNWGCISIFDAYNQYYWGAGDFQANSDILNELKFRGHRAILEQDNTQLINFSIDVLRWGKVINRNLPYIVNYQNLEYGSFMEEVIAGCNILNLNEFDDETSFNINLRLNSGFTKIYSLLIENFIIYDSRVSLALCRMIGEYLNENIIRDIPNELNFRIPPRRNGGNGYHFNENIIFRGINSPIQHQINNVRSSWILNKVLTDDDNFNSNFSQLPYEIRLRALESALFMIGYGIQ
ncbi:MAG: hypothetical protein ACK4YD_05040 [Chitinophagia bacterium]|jgi:hypothetical protein